MKLLQRLFSTQGYTAEVFMDHAIEKLMQDASIRKALGQRIKQLRKDKNWTQKELANEIEVSPAQLNKYESGLNTPPLNKLVLMAGALNTTLDHLLTGNVAGELPIHNTRLIQRLQAIESFGAEEKETVIKVLDAMIAKHNMESTVKSMGS